MAFDVASIIILIVIILSLLLCFTFFINFHQSTLVSIRSCFNRYSRKNVDSIMSVEDYSETIINAKKILDKNRIKSRPDIDEDLQGLSPKEASKILPDLLDNVMNKSYLIVDVGSKLFKTKSDKDLQDFVLSWLKAAGYHFENVRKGIIKINVIKQTNFI